MMLTVYRNLLRLYPAEYREQFGAEMLAVFAELENDNSHNQLPNRFAFHLREISGFVHGACREQLHRVFGSDFRILPPERSLFMRNGFRFPRTTIVFMAVILACAVWAIKKGEDIAASVPEPTPLVIHIQPVHSTLLPPIVPLLLAFYGAGLAGWAILFALRRSGVHRLADMSGMQK